MTLALEHSSAVDSLEKAILGHPAVDVAGRDTCPLIHRFAPGVYLREIFMPKGQFIIGQRHNTEHFNIVLKGRARVKMDDGVIEIVAPCTFVSKPGVRKVLYILEDMVWQTIHPTDETNLDKLQELLIEKTEAFEDHELLEKKKEFQIE